jgi:exopolyphosphatase/guanosine-5'-triphosphate,3'-diphosphate pyrophosphatase
LGFHQRELLEYAALLHDVGAFLTYQNHHAHTYYLIHNADLLGFVQSEISVMASTAFYHRKGLPTRKQIEFSDLSLADQEAVRVMGMFLRLSESLDRSHSAIVQRARFKPDSPGTVALEIESKKDAQLEVWGVESHREAFEKTFGLQLVIRQIPAQGENK